MADIFISYASSDRGFARKLATALQALGWSVWWDREIPIGQSFHRVIEQELDAAKCVVVLWSDAAISSDWVIVEAEEARRRRVLVPVQISDTRIPLAFRSYQTAVLSADGLSPSSAAFNAVLKAVHAHAPLGDGLRIAKAKAKRMAQEEATERYYNERGPSEEPLLIPSRKLARVIGQGHVTASEATRKIWEYIRLNRLQDPAQPTHIRAGEALSDLFEGQSAVTMFELARLIKASLRRPKKPADGVKAKDDA